MYWLTCSFRSGVSVQESTEFQRRTMLRNFFLALAVAALTLPASAQVKDQIQKQINDPRLDLFGGYSHVGNYGVGLNGWIGSANWHLYRFLGIEGDLSGGYGSQGIEAASVLPGLPTGVGSRMHNFNIGPQGIYHAPS